MLHGDARTPDQPYSSLCSLLPIQVHAPAEDFLLLSYATSLSERSLFVLTSRPLPVGTEVLLNLQPHNSGDRLVVKGKVQRFHSGPGPKGMEMELQPLEEEEGSRRLVRLIDRFFAKKRTQASQ
jgi:Tfp pilus assembly protein PilZ